MNFSLRLASVLVFSLPLAAVACSDDSSGDGPSGTTSTTTSAAGGAGGTGATGGSGGTGGTAGGGATGGSGGMGMGGSGGGSTGAQCQACAGMLLENGGLCAVQAMVCEGDTACQMWSDCVGDCVESDYTATCVDACGPAPVGAGVSLAACICTTCDAACDLVCE